MENPYKNRSIFTIADLRVMQEEYSRVLRLVEDALGDHQDPRKPPGDVYRHHFATVTNSNAPSRCTIANPQYFSYMTLGERGRGGGVNCPSCLAIYYFGAADQ
jgi:hypothetical protein